MGVFDSGLGGLTVVKQIKLRWPEAKIVYLGDTARVPYGTRSAEVVQEFAVQDARFLEAQGVNSIVIACNTASALATEQVRQAVSVPVYEVISAGAQAAIATGEKRIGVIGTRATIGSHAYDKAIRKLDPERIVYELACPLFVPLIEEGEIDGPLLEPIAREYLEEVKKWNVGTLVLGCTHYPMIWGMVDWLLDHQVKLIDVGEQLAANLPETLVEKGEDEYYVTDLTGRFLEMAGMFLGQDIGDRIELVHL